MMNKSILLDKTPQKNWQKIKLGDVADVIGGGTPSTKNYDFWNGDISWLTPKDLSGYKERYISKGERNITASGLQNSSARILPKGTVLLTSRAPIGYLAIAKQEVCTNQGFKSIVLKNGYLPEFFYYLLKNNIEYIIGMSSGSTFSEISGTQVKNLEFKVPPLDVQKKIAGVLGALDDKIELNNKINQNLEAQAQALFKSWFIDFDPFGGKMPIDWKEYKLSDFLPVITGKKNANVSSKKGRYPFFSCSQNISWTNEYSFDANAILVAGNGDFNIKFYKGKFEAYQRTYVLIPRNPYYAGWLYYVVKHSLDLITNSARGSVIKFITKGNLENFEFVAPINLKSNSVISAFNTINENVLKNIEENLRLAELRDTLLPKLMNGEIDVDNVKID